MFTKRARCPMPSAWVALAVVLASALYTVNASACGPCTAPELWGVQNLAGEPVVVTNFGLLSKEAGGWKLTCEERIGGLLLDVLGGSGAGLASTDVGLFTEQANACDWQAGPAVASNDWVFSLSLAGSSGAAASSAYALVIDSDTRELNVERSEAGLDFEVVKSFDSTSGYRELVAAGQPGSIFVAGYGQAPRAWRIAFSVDGGENWEEVLPEVDNEYATMRLQLVDPEQPHAVFFRAETVAGQGDEIWRFDADTQQSERLLTLEDGEIFGGMTLNEDSLWVAGRRRTAGSLYRAARADLEFERVVESGPAFECLSAHEGVFYACVNDFTYASKYLLGASMDEGKTWTPALTVEQLGEVDSCGAECMKTADWLHGAYGVPGSAGTGGASAAAATGQSNGTGGASAAAATGQSNGTGGAAAASNGSNSHRSSGGCQLAPLGLARGSLAGFVGLSCLLLIRRRRRSHHLLGAITGAALLVGCSSDDAATNQAETMSDTEPHCAGRGDVLADLTLESAGGEELSLLEYSPNPPHVGDNSWLIQLNDRDGSALSGVAESMLVTPFMPDHGHGTPVAVGVVEETTGEYRLSPINTFMPGLWQITLEFSAGNDTEQFSIDVCVE